MGNGGYMGNGPGPYSYDGTYVYVYNSMSSNTAVDMESTNGACFLNLPVNGVYTVCQYYYNVAPGSIVKFRVQPVGDNGLHVQPAGDGTPTGSWNLETCMVTINTVSGLSAQQSWNGPTGGTGYGDAATATGPTVRPNVLVAKRRKKKQENQGEAPATPNVAADPG